MVQGVGLEKLRVYPEPGMVGDAGRARLDSERRTSHFYGPTAAATQILKSTYKLLRFFHASISVLIFCTFSATRLASAFSASSDVSPCRYAQGLNTGTSTPGT